jgi:starvation-inducible outer membrane lipoprotein
MKPRPVALAALAASLLFSGCATTDSELTQKEKDKIARDMAREDQKQQQAQAKQMREATGTKTPRAFR